MTVVYPSRLGDMGKVLADVLKRFWETGTIPAERSAWETKVFFRRPKRAKRIKNLDTATQKQWRKWYGR